MKGKQMSSASYPFNSSDSELLENQPDIDEAEALRQELHEAVAENVKLRSMLRNKGPDVNVIGYKVVSCTWEQIDIVFETVTKAQYRLVAATQNGLIYTLFFEYT